MKSNSLMCFLCFIIILRDTIFYVVFLNTSFDLGYTYFRFNFFRRIYISCGQYIYNMKTSIRVSAEHLEKLDQLKLTPNESYENVVVRLLNTYEPLLKGDSIVHEGIKTNTAPIKRGER